MKAMETTLQYPLALLAYHELLHSVRVQALYCLRTTGTNKIATLNISDIYGLS